MPFSQSGITQISAQVNGPDLFVSWSSTSSAGDVFQVYLDHELAWFGPALCCTLPIPATAIGRNTWVDVGTVDPGESAVDFSSSLESLGQGAGMVQLTWNGGTYLDPTGQGDIQGFRVYQSPSANAPVDLTSPVDEVDAYPGRWISDGFGLGGFGQGGFGFSANTYAWSPGFLPSGSWQFCVLPFDTAGNNRGTGMTVSVNVQVPPRPPALSSSGSRVNYTYSGPPTRTATLNWLASPSG